MKKVLIPTKLDAVAKDFLNAHGGYSVEQCPGVDLLELAASHPDTYAMIVRSEKVSEEVIEAFPKLKLIIRAGAGYNTIDIQAARKRGIDVMNTPGANSNAVAEEVVALMLADARHLIPADASCRQGLWEKAKFMGREITGKTVGVVGLGHIGRLTIKRLSGFDMRVVGFDPMISTDRAEELGVELMSLEELFSVSDYITLHIPENAATKGIVNKDLFSKMKEGATLINCARYGVVNHDDLRAIKAEKNIRFLNDVYPKDEAGDKPEADIADIMLPHLGASSAEANANAAKMAARIIIDFDEKGITSFIVNRDIPEGLDETYGDLAYTLTSMARGLLGKGKRVKLLETSVYGDLSAFAEWLVVPMVTAINPDFDRSLDHRAALSVLEENGIEYCNRNVDKQKGYGNSITVDLTVENGAGELKSISIRGTVAENQVMIARINDFEKLYFDPKGHTLVLSFADRPGVLGIIAAAVAEAGINIDDVRNPHNEKGDCSIAVLKLNKAASPELVQQLAEKVDAHVAACVQVN
ncbi:3-phosphoglycerate dehydrogenase family protein [Kiritimatiellota bacterium B12222]|nr:3-phosphoglycerate dehydrogenase family protein [Kiritimatiellota bacterium B12222]